MDNTFTAEMSMSVSNAPPAGAAYFNRPLGQWSLLSFLKRLQELDYNTEYTFYERTINQVFDDTKRRKLLPLIIIEISIIIKLIECFFL